MSPCASASPAVQPVSTYSPHVSAISSNVTVHPRHASCHRSTCPHSQPPQGASPLPSPHSAHRSVAAGPASHYNCHHLRHPRRVAWAWDRLLSSPGDSNVWPWLRTSALRVGKNQVPIYSSVALEITVLRSVVYLSQ